MLFKRIKKCQGISTIEVLSALAIMALLVGPITGLMSQHIKSYQLTQKQTELQENLRGVLDEIATNIRKNSALNVCIIGTKLQIFDGSTTYVYNRYKPVGEKVYKIYRFDNNSPLTSDEININILTFEKDPISGIYRIFIQGETAIPGTNPIRMDIETKSKPRS